MRTLLPFLACLMLVLAAWSGMAHAAEATGCRETAPSQAFGHVDGGSDQSPADDGKGYPHHHGGCHGHHIGTAAGDDAIARPAFGPGAFGPGMSHHLAGHHAVPALRPPQA